MKTLILAALMLVTTGLFAQLPDAPQPQPTVDTLTVVHNAPSKLKDKEKAHRRAEVLTFIAVEAFSAGADVYDVKASERSFKHGYIESNTWLLCKEDSQTCRPSPLGFYARDIGIELVGASMPSILGYVFHRPEFFYGGLAGPIVLGIKHIQGGYYASHLK